ncbi:SAF domain-containing protein [Ornithinibacillus scapharcae]|uniref:SAF domain-containing protein n=1 Tax=Ornithinibacillus scapharcae TaxID=1147159 RepID=UPI000225B403|nr:SAF domain-containing protein [Ornithinibacillus scapharcae]
MLESKRRAIIFFIIAILLAATAGFLVFKKVQSLNAELGTMVRIYVAAKDVTSRVIITQDDVATEEIPMKYLKDDHITDVEFLMNKVSVVPLSPGDIITKSMLKEATAVTEEDNRLVALMKSDKVFFDEDLSALDRVDLFVSHDLDGEIVTEMFMEDVKVARVSKNSDGGLTGVQIEIPIEVVSEVIHMQNYAHNIRVIRANVGINSENINSPIEPTNDEDIEQKEDTQVENEQVIQEKQQEKTEKEEQTEQKDKADSTEEKSESTDDKE